ncbi:hypothetical protein BL250_13280 [Erwinia sp. OLTSP20]|uniref:hypothetical protein n=1 Tax=unclassified Erwinia TaxID=2622719 RepID=UPI000C184222|nr:MULTISPECIES: hypothetical protein [unclassified Erwinia]PIJ50392.1 hypothetical protein BV501_08845 [Erwinia sp. OAMSP11]PIJ71651.1 hypothetical protein BK416_11225 [Erwinia sp. OLSSP12]PIJ81035.1 hypothetical protein BLD47_10085 [Erwinia sp. OLCASP19]PIJ83293.1 hypothetical protein BLD46_10085 [Erwinia sp. OLMTSP26]PIJ85973.1 hypothetical protein BLD49_09390 [Erwinia sp. OLMDSP33]
MAVFSYPLFQNKNTGFLRAGRLNFSLLSAAGSVRSGLQDSHGYDGVIYLSKVAILPAEFCSGFPYNR